MCLQKNYNILLVYYTHLLVNPHCHLIYGYAVSDIVKQVSAKHYHILLVYDTNLLVNPHSHLIYGYPVQNIVKYVSAKTLQHTSRV